MRIALLAFFLAAALNPVAVAGETVKGQQRQFRLTDGQIDEIETFAGKMVAPDLAARFDALFSQWRHDLFIDASLEDDVLANWDPEDNSVKPPLSADSFTYVKTKAYRDLHKLGPAVSPLLVVKMTREQNPYNTCRLYRELETNPRLRTAPSPYGDNVSAAHHLAKLWLDDQIRQENSITPGDKIRLREIGAEIPESLGKEFAWRFHDWRVRRADEIRRDISPGESSCGDEIVAMGKDIVPLLLYEIAVAPGGWHALPLYEKVNPSATPLPPREENEHPQTHAGRVVKHWLADNGYSAYQNVPPSADFYHYPISPDDNEEFDRLASAATPEISRRFEKAYAAWLLARSPAPKEYDKWEEILTGGPEVDAIAQLGAQAIPLLVREMASDPNADFVMPLYKALQKDASLLPHIPEPQKAGALARRTAKMWLDTHRSPAVDASRRQLGSPEGPQCHLSVEQAKNLLNIVAAIPDQDKEEFDRQYALWRLYEWKCKPVKSPSRERYEKNLVAQNIKAIGRHAVPLLMERLAFDPDNVCALHLLYSVSPGDAYRSSSNNPWLTTKLAIVKNWLETQN